ncbi:MAG: [citrate (pro-3S)-lyase] ligase [Candidatus Izimaplasma sp.]|nr:[citrate (pro-3S)-lyase] ligase [Candidatus Izimaplasma bacterium]
MFQIKEVLLEEEKAKVIHFLHENNLDYETDIDYTIMVYDEDELIATASLARNVMKCFLVKKSYQDQNITGRMFRHLETILEARSIEHFFVYTDPTNADIFESFNMNVIVETMNTVLLEGNKNINQVLHLLKKEYDISDAKKSAVIINANPMTLGHMYLIEKAALESEELLVFVVSEDASSFPFEDRFMIIKNATEHLHNVTVLPTSNYLVSKITFPKYFLKEDQLIKDEQTLIDVLVYKEYFVPIFKINKRYLGKEPYSYNTNKYNEILQSHLGNHIKVIERKESDNKPISASLVRKLIKRNNLEKVKKYVPKATYDYLQSTRGQKIIEQIQSKTLRRH